MATKGTGWLWRRSFDLLPALARLVAAEIWHELRDQTARLDDRLRGELAQILPPSTGDGVNYAEFRGVSAAGEPEFHHRTC